MGDVYSFENNLQIKARQRRQIAIEYVYMRELNIFADTPADDLQVSSFWSENVIAAE